MRVRQNFMHLLPVGLCILGYFSYSCSDVLRKLWADQMSVSDILFWTNVWSIFFLMMLAPYMGGLKATFKSNKWGTHITRSIINGVAAFFGIVAFIKLPLVEAYTIIFLSPFIVAVIAVIFLGERLSAVKLMSLMFGFGGVVIAMNPDFSSIGVGTWSALGLTVCYSVTLAMIKSLEKTETHLSLVLFPTISACVLGFVFKGGVVELPSLVMLGSYALISVVTLGGMLCVSRAYTLANASSLSMTHYSQLIWGGVFGFFFFAEIPTLVTYIGTSIVVLSGVMLVFENQITTLLRSRLPRTERQPIV